MLLEIKRCFKNNFFITIILANILCVMIAWSMIVILSEIPSQEVDFALLSSGTYTVYLLLGSFVFGSIFIYQFNIDYNDKNIVFYKTLEYTPITYCLKKLATTCLISIFGTFISALIICLIYNQFGINFIVIFLKFSAVIIFYNIISYFLAFIFTNVLLAISINLGVWIFGLFMYSISPIFNFLSYYNYLTPQFQKFSNFLGGYVSYTDGTIINIKVNLQEMFISIGKDYVGLQ